MISQALKQWFWDCYDHLGRLLVSNLGFFLLLFPVFVLLPAFLEPLLSEQAGPVEIAAAYLIAMVVSSLFNAAWLAGLLHFGQLVSAEKDPPWRAVPHGVWLHFRRVLLFLLMVGLILGILLLNVWFYFASGQLTGPLAFVGYVLGGFFLWMIPFLFMIVLHALPFLVRNEARPLRALRFGFLVSMKYPWVTFSALIFLGSLWVLGAAVKFAGIFLFAFAGTAMLINSLHDVLFDTEERAGRLRKTQDSNIPKRPASWKELRQLEDETEEERLRRARYERTFRDLIRPWEG